MNSHMFWSITAQWAIVWVLIYAFLYSMNRQTRRKIRATYDWCKRDVLEESAQRYRKWKGCWSFAGPIGWLALILITALVTHYKHRS